MTWILGYEPGPSMTPLDLSPPEPIRVRHEEEDRMMAEIRENLNRARRYLDDDAHTQNGTT